MATTITPEPGTVPPVDPLDLYDRYAALTAAPLPHAIGPLEQLTQQRLSEDEPVVANLARRGIDPLRTAVPAALTRAAGPFDAQSAALAARLEELAASPDRTTPSGRTAQFFLVADSGRVHRERCRALARTAEALEPEIDSIARQADADVAAEGDAVPLAGPQRFVLDDYLKLVPHVDADGQVDQLEGVVGQAIRSPLTPQTRGLLRALRPIVDTMARDPRFAPETDRGARLGALAFTISRLSRSPEVRAAEGVRRYVELARVELPCLVAGLAARHAPAADDRELAQLDLRTLMLFHVE